MVDFDSLYHHIKFYWGDRKINVPGLVRFFERKLGDEVVWWGFIKATSSANVSKFDRLLEGLGFSRQYVFDAPAGFSFSPMITRTALKLNVFVGEGGTICPDIHFVTADPSLEIVFPEQTVWEFSCGPHCLPLSLLTPIPVQSYFGVSDEINLD